MKKLKNILILIPMISISCSSPYLTSYEPINDFLELEKKNGNVHYILKAKENNNQVLRIFNRGEESEHIVYSNEIDHTSKLFNEKQWKKLYKKYSQDTIKKYWKAEDFPGYELIEGSRSLLFSSKFSNQYPNVENVIILSEPLYYNNRKYIMFFYHIDNNNFVGDTQMAVVMRKENKKWIVVEKIGDYNCSGCL
ncbi:hypothetical protein [Flavobacterium saccharophilum]|jgi:hypothetical protein|uniref:Lipoprotein n=1 Tax=Flavobacterium saccharophilum TaxID=29534 RepID=A0A1M7LM48_9FLAO|nr:hypothetical protein [Flavobacterium saccharophilum]SHM79219.1 hypothetical protein SAMN05444366_4185 [Flavobacterium saccharophilum]